MARVGGSGVVVQAALSQLGKPYVWDTPLNAADPNPRSFDCSGLAMWCYHKAGVTLAHQTNVQYRQLKHRPLSEAEPGDLVFFGTLADLYHVGIFIGNSTIVEAPDYSIPVRKRQITPQSTGIWHQVGVFPGAQTTSGGAHPVTYQEFFSSVLERMGLPVTQANLRALARVSIIEGQNDYWNPLNSVVPSGQSTPFNSTGVQEYGSYDNGVTGTVKLLSGSAWSNVVAALRTGNSEGGVINAFSNTYASWGSHPSFGSISDSRADSLLTQSMGNAVAAKGPKESIIPPFDASKSNLLGVGGGMPKPPLSKTDRSKMLKFISQVKSAADKYGINSSHIPADATSSSQSDANLEIAYRLAYNAWQNLDQATNLPGSDIINGAFSWVDGVTKILKWLSDVNNWKRIGLFALGAVVLIIAAIEYLKG